VRYIEGTVSLLPLISRIHMGNDEDIGYRMFDLCKG